MSRFPDSGFGGAVRRAVPTEPRLRSHRFELGLTVALARTFQTRAIATLLAVSTLFQLLFLQWGDLPGLHFWSWFFFVDSEQTIPPLYSASTLLCCSGMVALIGWRFEPATDVWAWRALSLVLALAGVDEYAALHEKSIEPIRNLLAIDRGPLYYAWVIPGALAVVVLAVGFSGLVRRLPTDTRIRYLLAATLFVTGAVGFEAVAASYVSGGIEVVAPGVDPDAARSGLLYILLATTEEGLEMAGAALFLTATVRHLENHLGHRLSLTAVPIASSLRDHGRESQAADRS